jgi:hypothetical protein
LLGIHFDLNFDHIGLSDLMNHDLRVGVGLRVEHLFFCVIFKNSVFLFDLYEFLFELFIVLHCFFYSPVVGSLDQFLIRNAKSDETAL